MLVLSRWNQPRKELYVEETLVYKLDDKEFIVLQ